jgi:hypothetical protein
MRRGVVVAVRLWLTAPSMAAFPRGGAGVHAAMGVEAPNVPIASKAVVVACIR